MYYFENGRIFHYNSLGKFSLNLNEFLNVRLMLNVHAEFDEILLIYSSILGVIEVKFFIPFKSHVILNNIKKIIVIIEENIEL